ncbi:MAG: hypothetical protein ABWY51_02460 [Gaiellaceae bacterium]
MNRRAGRPPRAELEALAATLAPGQQRAVGGGIYLRLDGTGRMRFQFRLRAAGAQLDRARRTFRSALLDAHEAGASKTELARELGVSRQRVDEVLARARHERAVGVEDVTG